MFKYLVILVLLIAIETLAQFFIEKKIKNKKNLYLVLGILLYGVVGFLYYLFLISGTKLAIANVLWNAGTGLSVTMVGWYFFNQTFNFYKILGLMVTLIGLTLLTV